jgi:hypothetical protein
MNDMQDALKKVKQVEARREMTKYSDIARKNAERIKRKAIWGDYNYGFI